MLQGNPACQLTCTITIPTGRASGETAQGEFLVVKEYSKNPDKIRGPDQNDGLCWAVLPVR